MSFDLVTFVDDKFELDFYEKFLPKGEVNDLLKELKTIIPPTGNRRNGKIFGDPGLVYTVNYFGITSNRPTTVWPDSFAKIRDRITKETGQVYTICALQMYPNGSCGINPHRDKEMIPGTMICGLSVGCTRKLVMTKGYPDRDNYKEFDLDLNSGSLYIFKPPTNDYWAHSIKKDSSTGVRYSLTFRNY